MIRECVRRLLAGESIRSICTDLNVRGVVTATGKEWSPQTLRRMLASPRISGQREHRGKVVADAVWPAIVSAAERSRNAAAAANPPRA